MEPNQIILKVLGSRAIQIFNPNGSLNDVLKVSINIEVTKNYVDRVNNTLQIISQKTELFEIDNNNASITIDGVTYTLDQIFGGQGTNSGERNASNQLIFPDNLLIIPFLRPFHLIEFFTSVDQIQFYAKTLELWSLRSNTIKTKYENEIKKINQNNDDNRSGGGAPLDDVTNPNPNVTDDVRQNLNGQNNNNTSADRQSDVTGTGSGRLIAESWNINKDGVRTLKIGDRHATITGDGYIDVDGVPVGIEDVIIIKNGTAISVLEAIKTDPDVSWFYDEIFSKRNIELPQQDNASEIDYETAWLSTEGAFEGGSADIIADSNLTDDVNNAEDGSTTSGDGLDKNPAKEKSQETPEGAPEQVEQSPAMTKRNFERIQGSVTQISPSLLAQNQRTTGKIGVRGYWAFRRYPDNTPFGKPEYELNKDVVNGFCTVDGKIGSVQYHFGGDLYKLRKQTGRGVAVIGGRENVVDFPIWMNFPEVGLWNTLVPYVADNQTEQHMGMIPAGTTYFHNLPGGYGIGLYENVSLRKPDEANWGIAPPWCGITTNAVIKHGGYMHYHGSVIGAGDGAEDWWLKSVKNFNGNKIEDDVGFSKWGMFASIPVTINNGENSPIKSFFRKNPKTGEDMWSKGSHQSTEAFLDKPIEEEYTEMVERRQTVYEPDPNRPNGKIKKIQIIKEPVIKKRKIAQLHYEQLLPNPTGIIFLKGVHYDPKDGITAAGTRLLDHLFNQIGWEIGAVTRNSHVETLLYLNPDLTGVNIGGNTGSRYSKYLHQGNHLTVKKFDLTWPGTANFFVITKCICSWGSQKVESNLNGKFRRTPIVDSYYSLIGKEKNIFSGLKSFYDRILD